MTIEVRRTFHTNGRVKREFHLNSQGQKHGMDKCWRVDGNVLCEISYRYDLTHGMVKWFYRNGQPENEASWHEGKLHGISKGWNDKGSLLRIGYHRLRR